MPKKNKDKTYTWVLEVQQYKNTDECYIELPDELLKEVGWKIGDKIIWEETKNGWKLKKVECQTSTKKKR